MKINEYNKYIYDQYVDVPLNPINPLEKIYFLIIFLMSAVYNNGAHRSGKSYLLTLY